MDDEALRAAAVVADPTAFVESSATAFGAPSVVHDDYLQPAGARVAGRGAGCGHAIEVRRLPPIP